MNLLVHSHCGLVSQANPSARSESLTLRTFSRRQLARAVADAGARSSSSVFGTVDAGSTAVYHRKLQDAERRLADAETSMAAYRDVGSQEMDALRRELTAGRRQHAQESTEDARAITALRARLLELQAMQPSTRL